MKQFVARNDLQKVAKSAFSTPEMIVVLAFIGIIAAFLISNLVDSINEKKNMVALRKIRNTLTQVTGFLVSDNSSPIYWDLKDYDYESAQKAYAYYRPYFKVLKECSNQQGCWKYPTRYLSGRVYLDQTEPYQYMFTLVDGMHVLINVFPKEIIDRAFGVKVSSPSVVFIVDLNGDKNPNQVGLDIFAFVLRDENVVPAGIDTTYNCNTAAYGLACTARVMENGWRINYK